MKGTIMAARFEVYKCETSGNIVEVLEGGGGTLACCGSDMTLMVANTVDAAKEKHVPVIETSAGKITVKVGEVAHPMEEKHYISWIEIIADGKTYRQYLKAGDTPEATFDVEASQVTARSYCNLHGFWKV